MLHRIVNGVQVALTATEEVAYRAAQPNEDMVAMQVRAQRDHLLASTDWTALSDNTMSSAMAAYRQALRDVPAQEGFPHAVTWPSKP